MTTKERIWDEALTLFAYKGYSGTSVKDIANAVGIKDSSLYKHYRSKREIFDTVIAEAEKRMSGLSGALNIPDGDDIAPDEVFARFDNISLEELLDVSRKTFLFYLEDPFFMRVRRMLNREQYGNGDIYRIYRKIFMENSIEYITRLFGVLRERNVFHGADADVMAVNFYAPVFFLLSKYDGMPETRDEALAVLEKQISEFTRMYVVKH